MSRKTTKAMLRTLVKFGRNQKYFTFTDLRECLGVSSGGQSKNALWHRFTKLQESGVVVVAEAYDKKRFKRYMVPNVATVEALLDELRPAVPSPNDSDPKVESPLKNTFVDTPPVDESLTEIHARVVSMERKLDRVLQTLA